MSMEDIISILDCTLRDGSYIVEGKFGSQSIKGIIGRLARARVDIVECGWLKDNDYEDGTVYYHQPQDAENLILKKSANTLYVAMIDWNRYDVSKLSPCDGKSIDAIRVVFPRDHVDEGLALVPQIKEKGYKVLVQAANTYGYSDLELEQLVEKVNKVHPEALSIVDTFGAMYKDDLERIMNIVHNKLDPDIKLGFHSHNNQQMSFSLAQDFIEFVIKNQRSAIVDCSLCGMGRGAGNANTELIVNYLNRKHLKNYDLDLILDTIDIYMNRFVNEYQWGYSVPFFIAGINCTHVNNIAYLQKKHYSKTRDIENIIESLTPQKRIEYDYENLENAFMKYISAETDDEKSVEELKRNIESRNVLLIGPGRTSYTESEKIFGYIEEYKPIVISINWLPNRYKYDYAFFSNIKRYEYAKDQVDDKFNTIKKIVTSNLKIERDLSVIYINYNRLLRRRWKQYDNSLFLCLGLLDQIEPKRIGIAGIDGWTETSNYSDENLESTFDRNERKEISTELKDMMKDYVKMNGSRINIDFVTKSIFDFCDNDK